MSLFACISSIYLKNYYRMYEQHVEKNREPLYVIGNGWSSYFFLKNINKRLYRPIVISPNEMGLNTSKLVDYLDSYNDTSLSLPKVPKTLYIRDSLTKIDEKNQRIYTEKGKTIPYKKIVLAIGSKVNDFGVPGVLKESFFYRSLDDRLQLQKKLVEKNYQKINIIGSGPVGIELAFKLKYQGHDVHIWEGLNDILPGFSPETKREVRSKMNLVGINYSLNRPIVKVSKNYVYPSGSPLHPHDFSIWTGGIKRIKIPFTSFEPSSNKVNEKFEIYPNVYCIGDMVEGRGPPTAQNAKYQAKWLANHLNGKKQKEYIPSEVGKIIHIDDKIYLESKFYQGYLPSFFQKWIDWFYLL